MNEAETEFKSHPDYGLVLDMHPPMGEAWRLSVFSGGAMIGYHMRVSDDAQLTHLRDSMDRAIDLFCAKETK